MAEVTDIDPEQRLVILRNEELPYDDKSSPPALAITTLAMTTGKRWLQD